MISGEIELSLIHSNSVNMRSKIWRHSRSSHPEMFLRKGVLKICSKFTGEQRCQSVISIKLLCNFIEITLRYGCSPVNLLYIFRIPFPKNTSGRLLLTISNFKKAILPTTVRRTRSESTLVCLEK